MNIEQACENMLKQQLRAWDVLDEQILSLFKLIPRDRFIPAPYKELAFADTSIPLGHGQTTMPPKEEAVAIQALAFQPTDKALVIGTGCGYITALIAKLSNWVYSIDNVAAFTESAKLKLHEMHINNATLITGDPIKGWEPDAPFDAIFITGSLPFLPHHFQENLTIGGRLFAIIGQAPVMEATLIKRLAHDRWQIDKLFETQRPRLINKKENTSFRF